MPASIRLPPELQEQLRSHAERHQLSASEVVRAALTKYLAEHAASPYELGAGLFGRYGSGSGDTVTYRSTERKALIRERMQRKYPRR
ncbi:MAG: ribbon-helix-helix protein, CopG family [Xanthomonadales bacterium]|nr:ribbon-helix-helix protein, CopG family [Xanthomonadales bacterium]